MNNFLERYKKTTYFTIFIFVCLNFFAWQEVFYLYEVKYLKVEFLNVGQGDSAFVVTPQNHQIIIDGGPDSIVVSKIAKQVPFWDRSLDLVILSHPEKDHMSGLIEVLKRYKADYIVWSGIKKQDAEYLEWLKVLVKQKNAGAKIITATAGQEIIAGDLVIDILNPKENLFGKEVLSTSNDTSVVNRLIYGGNSFLFTGDIDAKTEKELVEKFNLNSDVLKVAHHGSKYSTSEELLQNVKPDVAVISVGKNSYGHPTQETLQRLENFGINVLQTDQSKDIILISNGQKINIINK